MKTKTRQELIAETMVKDVEPVVRKYAAQAEANRRLAPEAVKAIVNAGLMRPWTPKAYAVWKWIRSRPSRCSKLSPGSRVRLAGSSPIQASSPVFPGIRSKRIKR